MSKPRYFNMTNLFIVYWANFWFMNGLDKFLNRQDLNIFTWYGKDRSTQFGGYFDKTSLPDAWMHPLLYLTGVWEILVAIPLYIVLYKTITLRHLDQKNFDLGMFWGGATFVGFAFFDIIFGDRAELWEHGTFLILVGVAYVMVMKFKEKDLDN